MSRQSSKDQLLKDISTERRRLEKNLSALNAEDMTQPGVTGAWSVKDILAHLVACHLVACHLVACHLVAWEKLFLGLNFRHLTRKS
jgi:uncharacterized damage-inducible protein DinB